MHRKVLVKTILLISCGLIFFKIAYNLINPEKISFREFNSGLKLLEGKSEALMSKAKLFDKKHVINNLPANALNGYYFRFDDHIGKAKVITDFQKPPDTKITELKFDRDEFLIDKGGIFVSDFEQIVKPAIGTTLKNKNLLNIRLNHIGCILIRIKTKKINAITLGWGEKDKIHWWLHSQIINLIPDGEFHIYKIETEKIRFFRDIDSGDTLNNIGLSFMGEIDKDFAIDYVKIIKKEQMYQQAAVGTSFLRVNNELRPVIFIVSNTSVIYEIDLPEKEICLSFGISALSYKPDSSLRIIISSSNQEEVVYFKNDIRPDLWLDRIINLSKWKSKKIRINFSFASQNSNSPNTLFLSSPIIYSEPGAPFKAIIFLEDALRADHLSCYGYKRITSPEKDSFAKEGIIFQNAFSQETSTRPSVSSFMTSLYPTAIGVWNFADTLGDNYLTLAEILRNQGFLTVAFVQNASAISYMSSYRGFDLIFDTGKAEEDIKALVEDCFYPWLEENFHRNFFCYIHTINPHSPYDPPEKFRVFFKEESSDILPRIPRVDPEWLKNPSWENRTALYDGEILYNDYWFGKIIKKLKEINIFNNTLFFSIADHGEFLGERGLIKHRPPGFLEVLHVPFLVAYPEKLPKNIRIRENVQLIDIMPTILDYARIDKKDMLLAGDSLVSLIEKKNPQYWANRIIFSEEISDKFSKDDWNLNYGSVFFKNYHFINSKLFAKDYIKKVSKLEKFLNLSNPINVYDFYKDYSEVKPLNSFTLNMIFKNMFLRSLGIFQRNNITIWKIIKDKQEGVLDKEYINKLKSLNYLE